MAHTAPRLPEQYKPPRGAGALEVGDFHVSELAADVAGALSPFGQDLEFPLPLAQLRYAHPGPASRPHLADGR